MRISILCKSQSYIHGFEITDALCANRPVMAVATAMPTETVVQATIVENPVATVAVAMAPPPPAAVAAVAATSGPDSTYL